MRDKWMRFMQGRYGNDRLNQFLMIVALVFLVISFIGGNFFYLVALVPMVISYYRMLSRKTSQRVAENQWYYCQEMKVKGFFLKTRNGIAQRKTHHIYKCPNCKQKLRIPKGRGKIEISCRKCGTKFFKNS